MPFLGIKLYTLFYAYIHIHTPGCSYRVEFMCSSYEIKCLLLRIVFRLDNFADRDFWRKFAWVNVVTYVYVNVQE